jgi:hypothetical protein
MIKSLVITAAVLLSPTSWGLDLIGLLSPRFRCDDVIASVEGKRFRLGWLHHSFGNDLSCLKRLVALPGFEGARIHLINETCARNRTCARHEYLAGLSPRAFEKRLINDPIFRKRIKRIAKRAYAFYAEHFYPESRFWVGLLNSPALETQLSSKAFRLLADIVGAEWPGATIVYNPLTKGRIRGYVSELHGVGARLTAPCIVSLDGSESPSLSQLKSFVVNNRQCLILDWQVGYNCREPGETSAVSPRSRNCQALFPPRLFLEGL